LISHFSDIQIFVTFSKNINNQKTINMSEENKDLGDMEEDAKDNAKDGAENIGDTASDAKDLGEKLDDAKEATKEFAEDAKEAASEFADDVKNEANEFKENVHETFSPDNPDSGKTVAIIAHLTLIGWIIALIMNNGNKTEIGSFYIRQVLGIILVGIVISWIPLVNFIGWIFVAILWLISLVGAFSGEQKKVFLVGDYFQDWFKSL
jgi:uncharacterized membrane protein